MKQTLLQSLLLFAALMTIFLLSRLYLSPPVQVIVLAVVFIALSAWEFRSLRALAVARSVPTFWQKPGLAWLFLVAIDLLMGAGFSGIQILVAYDAREVINYPNMIAVGLTMASALLLSNRIVHSFTGSKAIQPKK